MPARIARLSATPLQPHCAPSAMAASWPHRQPSGSQITQKSRSPPWGRALHPVQTGETQRLATLSFPRDPIGRHPGGSGDRLLALLPSGGSCDPGRSATPEPSPAATVRAPCGSGERGRLRSLHYPVYTVARFGGDHRGALFTWRARRWLTCHCRMAA